MATTEILAFLRKREGWAEAVAKLKDLADLKRDCARGAAKVYANAYEARRGAIVFDVVASRQRSCKTRVLPRVAQWEATDSASIISALTSTRIKAREYGISD